MSDRPKAETIAKDFDNATAPYAQAGYKVFAREVYERRRARCVTCDWFHNTDGLDHCEHPDRNCRKLIPFLNQKCPVKALEWEINLQEDSPHLL